MNAHTFVSVGFDDATKARMDEFAQLVKRAEDVMRELRLATITAAGERDKLASQLAAVLACPDAARADARSATEQSAKTPAPRWFEMPLQPGVSGYISDPVQPVAASALQLQPGKFYEDTRGYKWCVYSVGASGTTVRAVRTDNAFTSRFHTDGKRSSGADLVREVAP